MTLAAMSGTIASAQEPAEAPAAAPAADAASPAEGETAPTAGCGVTLPGEPEITAQTSCQELGVRLMDRYRTGGCLASDAPTSALEPAKPDSLGAQGSPAQVGAAPSIATTPLAGGALAIGATREGPRLVAALALNPGTVFAEDSEALATTSRLSDVSVVVPFDTSRDPGERPVDYVGVRARLNLLAFTQGSRALEVAVGELKTALDEYARQLDEVMLTDFDAAMQNATDRSACMQALWSCAPDDEVAEVCGGRTMRAEWQGAREVADAARQRVRREVDGDTIGLDLRADFGDATLTGRYGLDESFSMLAAGAFSWRFLRGARSSVSLRGRLGMAYRHSERRGQNVAAPTEYAVDWGVSLAAALATGPASTELSAGVEGRERTSATPSLPATFEAGMEYTDLRLGVAVPITETNSLGIGVTIPIDGRDERTPMLALTGDWTVGFGMGRK